MQTNRVPFTGIDELHGYLEKLRPERPDDVDTLRLLHNSYAEALPGELKEALRIELNSLTAWLGDGTWLATVYGIQGTHLTTDVPYIETRTAASANPYLKIGYTYALWQLDRQPRRARDAVDAALLVLPIVQADIDGGAVGQSAFIQPTIESAFLMSGRTGVNYRRTELVDAVTRFALDTSVALGTRRGMIDIALSRRAAFGATDLTALLPAADDILSESHRGGVQFIVASARVARQLAMRVGIPDADTWNRREADAYVTLTKSNPQALLYEAAATRAIALLRQIGDDEARVELERRYEEAISQQVLHEFSGEIDLSDYIAHERKVLATLLDEHGGMGVIAYLGVRPSLLPTRIDVQQQTDSILEKTIFQDLAQHVKLAPDGRVVAHSSIGEENRRTEFVKQFQLFLSVYSRAAIAAFADGVAAGQLNDATLAQFFSATWIAKPVLFPQQNDQPTQYSIVSRLLPGLRMLIGVFDGGPRDDLIPTIDSLTPGLELLLRMLCRRLGLPTVVARTDQQGRPVDEVESLGVHLRRPRVRSVLGEDLATALDVILLEPFGYGVRDDVAHSLLFPQQYTLELATLLAVAIIRIAAVSEEEIVKESKATV